MGVDTEMGVDTATEAETEGRDGNGEKQRDNQNGEEKGHERQS